MLRMKKGCTIKTADKLQEQYEADEHNLTANVHADRINTVMQQFIMMQESRLFFILELPATETEENQLRKTNRTPLHKDVYYIDGLTKEDALLLLIRYGDLLINDGLCCFGFGNEKNTAEIMSEKYNIVTLWRKSTNQYNTFFKDLNIPQTSHLITAWDTFSNEVPGESNLYESKGKNIYALADELKDWGIIFRSAEKTEHSFKPVPIAAISRKRGRRPDEPGRRPFALSGFIQAAPAVSASASAGTAHRRPRPPMR